MKSFTTIVTLLASSATLISAAPAPAYAGYTPGWCGLKITQYQKNENGVGGDYKFDFGLFDNIQNPAGGAKGVSIPDFSSYTLPAQDTPLPNAFTFTIEGVDEDPILVAYGSTTWRSSKGCSIEMGKGADSNGYEDGKRVMDCGFTC